MSDSQYPGHPQDNGFHDSFDPMFQPADSAVGQAVEHVGAHAGGPGQLPVPQQPQQFGGPEGWQNHAGPPQGSVALELAPAIDPRLDPTHPEFEDPHYDPREWEPLRRRSPFIFRAAVIIGIVAFAVITAVRFVTNWVDVRVDPPGDPTTEVAIEIPSGATADDIARILAGEEVVPSSLVTSYWWRRNEAPAFRAGEYVFRRNSSVEEAQAVLEAGPLPPVFNGTRVVFPEGFTVDDIEGRMLDELPEFDPRELAAAVDAGSIRSAFQPNEVTSLEGLLFPATYEIREEELGDERALVQQMVNTFDARARFLGLQNSQSTVGYSPWEVLIIASLIEKEARLDEERPKIARVIYNRLAEVGQAETYGLLQIDATLIYALGDLFDYDERDGQVLTSDTEVQSPYNTYQNAGLPPGPIANPGEASIRAALFPEPGDWRYYVLVDEATGAHAFTNTYAQHQAAGGT